MVSGKQPAVQSNQLDDVDELEEIATTAPTEMIPVRKTDVLTMQAPEQ